MTQPLISLSNIRCNLNRIQQFNALNWSLESGQNWVIYGGNGTGKTAFAKLLAGLLPISGGQRQYHPQLDPKNDIEWISADSQKALQKYDQRFDDSETREDAHDIGRTVSDIIFSSKEADANTLAQIEQLDMSAHLNKGIRFISSGQIRKTLLLKAYVKQPKIIIIDDPLIGLDSNAQHHIKTLIKQLALSPKCQLILLLRRQQDIVDGMSHFAQLDNCQIIKTGLLKDGLPSTLHYKPAAEKNLNLPLERPAITAGQELIKLQHVDAHYRDKYVFKNQSFSLIAGEHINLHGPNGSGKSTLISFITGDNHMAYGQEVWLFGQKRGSGESVWSIKRQFGIISNHIHEQHSKHARVEDVIISGLYDTIGLYDKPSSQDKHKAKLCMEFLGITELKQKRFKQISYGQQRLALLGRALIKQPPIILLDEALTGLDDEHKWQFIHNVEQLAASTDITLVNISHMPDEQLPFINKTWQFVSDEANPGLHKLHVQQA